MRVLAPRLVKPLDDGSFLFWSDGSALHLVYPLKNVYEISPYTRA